MHFLILKQFKLFRLTIAFLFCFFLFFNISPVLADSTGYEVQSGSSDKTTWGGDPRSLQQRMGLGNDDPRYIIANIINIALGFLGIVALGIIMYSGFLWMTSQGSPDKINDAKKILIGGVAGLIIILSAFAIAAFILDAIYRVTTDGKSGIGGASLPLTGPGGGSGVGGGSDTGGFMDVPCSSSKDTCSPDDSICSKLGPAWSCGGKCVCVADNLGSCYNETANVCNYPCSSGLSCFGGDGCNNNSPTNGCGQDDDSCQCCCSPENDKCNLLYPSLKCKPDSGSCSGPARGMCCGCTADSQCGSPSKVGCGNDTCCNNRPEVMGVTPMNNATDVCTNALISVRFTQAMKSSELAANFLVVGDYGKDPCTDGTRPISISGLNIPGLRSGVNYCAVNGGYLARTSKLGNFVDFSTKKFFRINTKYYIIVKGDPNISNNADEGILNYWGISMNGPYSGSWSSSFTTINDKSEAKGVCVIEKVVLAPPSHLINRSADSIRENDKDASDPTFDTDNDSDKLFEARALSRTSQAIVPVTGYFWDWDFTSSVSSVANFDETVINMPVSSRLVQIANEVTDGRSIIRSAVNMSKYKETNTSMTGDGLYDTSSLYVFICNNPWPPINPLKEPNWEPWRPKENPYNYEIYYCRDRGSSATMDDLPAFNSEGISNSTAINNKIKQQVYFTYEVPPAPGEILVATSAPASADHPEGGVVYLEWTAASSKYAEIKGYKVYWGEYSGNYTDSIDVGLITKAKIAGLENNQAYFFSITAFTPEMAESSKYAEKKAIPYDNYAPGTVPTFLVNEIKVKSNQVTLSWSEVNSAKSYIFAYGLEPDLYGVVKNVKQDTSITVTGLTPSQKYYFAIKSVDASGNEGAYNSYATSTSAR